MVHFVVINVATIQFFVCLCIILSIMEEKTLLALMKITQQISNSKGPIVYIKKIVHVEWQAIKICPSAIICTHFCIK